MPILIMHKTDSILLRQMHMKKVYVNFEPDFIDFSRKGKKCKTHPVGTEHRRGPNLVDTLQTNFNVMSTSLRH